MTPEGAAQSDRGPWVSVVLPAYNGTRTIEHTLRSVAAQDYRPLDLVVVDDGSSEPMAPIVQAATSGSGLPVDVLRHAENLGLSRTLNDGWRRAAGELILILHQDVELVGSDWVRRAVAILESRADVQVVTCDYHAAALDELNFAARAFGFLRRQFYHAPESGREIVTFTEFKCDMVRRSALERVGGFPANFRIAGEDLAVSYRLRKEGGAILKAYDLQGIQRFADRAASIRGNLWKEYRFGMAFAGVFVAVRGYPFRGLETSPYSRSRARHRALQPPVALAGLLLLLLGLASGWAWPLEAFVLLVTARFAGYAVRLWPDFARVVRGTGRATAETLGAAALGLLTDVVYSAGLAVGLVRAAVGAPL